METKIEEIWKDIPGWEGLYKVSNTGLVKSLKRPVFLNGVFRRHTNERILKPWLRGNKAKPNSTEKQYLCVALCMNSDMFTHPIHRLVALAFLPNPENLPEVNHKDCNKLNNNLSNLEWISRIGNAQHARASGQYQVGEQKENAILTESQVWDMLMLRYQGVKYKHLIQIFNVSESCVSHVIKGRKWNHIHKQFIASHEHKNDYRIKKLFNLRYKE